MNAITTQHNLDFEMCPDPLQIFMPGLLRFRIGTVKGQYGICKNELFILSITNDQPGNGHLEDVFQWFEFSCKEYDKNFMILEFQSHRFYLHCIRKRGFIPLDSFGQNAIKVFNEANYIRLKKEGSEVIEPLTNVCKP